MGCDIHLYVEVKHGDDWAEVQRNLTLTEDFFGRKTTTFHLDWGEHRNYNVFAMLADVRNGHGFAGIDTGDGFEPISPPRGLPHDRSYTILEKSEEWGRDGHSHSYLTLRELLDLEAAGYWDKSTEHRGVFLRAELEQAQADGIVESIDGQDVVLTESPRTGYAGDISGPPDDEIFRLRFTRTYRESAGWLPGLIDRLVELGSSWDLRELWEANVPRNSRQYPTVILDKDKAMDHWVDTAEWIRIVFWFDN